MHSPKLTNLRAVWFAISLGAVVLQPAWGQPCTLNEQQRLTASDSESGDRFGEGVALSGDVALVGAWNDDDACPANPGCNSGSVYVYRFDGSSWNEEPKLHASDEALGDWFGRAVSIDGEVAVIGAMNDGSGGCQTCGHGSAYVYQYDSMTGVWSELAKLTASDPGADDRMGVSVSISGDLIVVGSVRNGVGGAAYVFDKPSGGWMNMTETAKLTASDAATGDGFGFRVSVSGDVALVGARDDDDGGSNSGSAYIFDRPAGGWVDITETAKLVASDAASGDNFSVSVALSGNVAVIGATNDEHGGLVQAGSAYIFESNRSAICNSSIG